MPRQARIDIQNMVYHVFTRGHNKSALLRDDEDRYVFLRHLKRAQDRFPWECLGYSLMTNHYHLQVKTLDSPLGKTMHYLNSLYAGHFNYRYKTFGHVFQNRFHSIPVQTESYLLRLSRYIHLNAVDAGMVQRPEDHRWSSYREYLGGNSSGLINTDLVLNTLCGIPSLQKQRYREFVEQKLNQKPEFNESILRKTRIFGDDPFVQWIRYQCPEAFVIRRNLQPATPAI
jgi:putative transposase